MYEVPRSGGVQIGRWGVLWVGLTSVMSMIFVALIMVDWIRWWLSLDNPRLEIVTVVIFGIVPALLYTIVIVVRAYPLRWRQKPTLGASIIYWPLSIMFALFNLVTVFE